MAPSTWIGVSSEEDVWKGGTGRRKCVFVCEWFGMGGGNSLHASIFFVNGGVLVAGA